MRILLLLTCAASVANAYRAHDLIRETQLTETSLLRMQQKMARLNNIQEEILTGHKSPGRRPVTSNAAVNNINEDFPVKPDQLPYLFEGDIVLTDSQMDEILLNAEDQLWAIGSGQPRRKRSLTSNLAARWTSPIAYYIDTATGVDEKAVLAGVNKWQEKTCLTFNRVYSKPTVGNALEFILGSGCYSFIGRTNAPQQVSIGNGCTSLGTVMHEIGHALGFFHEQSRYDRDDYIKLVTQNIQPFYLGQFTKQSKSSIADYGVAYDFGSAMHYDQASFTANGGTTMMALDQNYQLTMGQRVEASYSDVKRINLAYCNSSCTTQLDCLNGGYTDPKNCAQCRCPDGFGGILCDRASNAVSACGVGDLTANNTFQTISAQGAYNCPYVITAPPGKKVYFEITDSRFTSAQQPCFLDYVEIKYKKDFVPAGARFCRSFPTNSLSEGEKLIVIYRGTSYTRFGLKFRQDPISAETTTQPSVTTEQTTTTTSPTTTTTTTTTTPKPTTTTSTTTTTTTTTTTRRPVTTTTRPTTTTTRRTTLTTGTTSTPPPTTTKLELSTFFPSVTTASPCSAWTQCTARCGACGTTSRRCNGVLETRYCNVQPCDGEYCCRPFFYVKQGFCVRPYQDEQLITALDDNDMKMINAKRSAEKKQ